MPKAENRALVKSMLSCCLLLFTCTVSHAQGLDAMRERLEPLGWSISQQADGSLILVPPTDAEPLSAEAITPAKATAAGAAALSAETERRLHEQGWRVERHASGTVNLFPPQREAVRPPADCGGHRFPEVGVDLPVDSWQEARDIADAWLRANGQGALVVGKIRQILHVYLVSIVDAEPPHVLRHQLTIRDEDGRTQVAY